MNCPDCDAEEGCRHELGCAVEICPMCGGQRAKCGCRAPEGEGVLWSGRWPGEDECEEYGFWCCGDVEADGGRVPCDRGHPGATHDLDRLACECEWDRERRKWVRKEVGSV